MKLNHEVNRVEFLQVRSQLRECPGGGDLLHPSLDEGDGVYLDQSQEKERKRISNPCHQQ